MRAKYSFYGEGQREGGNGRINDRVERCGGRENVQEGKYRGICLYPIPEVG